MEPAIRPERTAEICPVPGESPPPDSPARIATAGDRLRSAAFTALVLSLLWLGLTGGGAEAWAFGIPAILAGIALVQMFPPATRWRLSPMGTLRFVLWFAWQSVLGSVDVAARALAWRVRVRPTFRHYHTALPEGAPRLVFANAITLLPGTMSAGMNGTALVIHMLDRGADLEAELGALERRVAALFAISLPPQAGGKP